MSSKHFEPARSWMPLLAITLLAACQSGDVPAPADEDSQAATDAAVPSDPPTLDELANATYTGLTDEPVQLEDGRWEGEPFVEGGASRPAVGLVDHFVLTGDLDGDGDNESVALLWTSSGGSGTFDHLAVMDRTGDGILELGTAAVGDRVKVRAARIVDGKIVLDVLEAGPDDAACCPTQLATRTWALVGDGLTELESEITGTISLAVLDATHWMLTDFAWDEPAPSEPRVTLDFEPGRIGGNAGCNGFFASIEASGEGVTGVTLGAIGATRKMCPEPVMTVEDRFLEQLEGVSSFSFLGGKLLLDWTTDESSGSMLFAPREPNGD